MLLGLISDTHDNVVNIRKAVSIFNDGGVSLVLHAGDFTSPFSLEPLKELNAEFAGVFGNNDGDLLLLDERSEHRIHKQPYQLDWQEKRIIVMHEPDLIEALADSGHYDIIVYGHTHRASVKSRGRVLIVNPGETGNQLYGKATVALIDTDKMKTEIISLE